MLDQSVKSPYFLGGYPKLSSNLELDTEALLKINKLSEIEDAVADESQKLNESSTMSN